MRWLWPGCLFGLAAVLLAPREAQAHLVTTGLGPFYDGAMHLVLSPEDLLGLISAALLAGMCGPQAGRWTLAALPISWFLGALIGMQVSNVPTLPAVSIFSFAALGLLVALDVKLSPWAVAAIASLFGLLHGVLNGGALAQANGVPLNVIGIVTTVFVLVLLISGAVVSLRPGWTRVAVRVAGSWVVAVGMLMLGWLFRGTV